MDTNPYAPPKAVVADISEPVEPSTAPPLFAVSLLKLTVMSLCTGGIYEIYWFYRNWKLIGEREKSNIYPFWRAFFRVIFCYSCFARIRDIGKTTGLAKPLPAGGLATGWIVVTISWKLPDPYWWITYLAVAFLLPVQAHVNAINKIAAPEHDPNARFTVWNWLAIVAGGSLLVLAIIGMFVGQE
jgi:hypothetical protein